MCQKMPAVAELFPPFQRAALVAAWRAGDLAAIDAATDDLVRLGLCRPRHDNVMPCRAEVARGVAAVRGLGA